MKLQAHISKIVDLPNYDRLTQREFNNKFGNSYLLLNDTPVFILGVEGNLLETNKGSIPITEQHTLKPLMPKTGIYKINDNLFYLQRLVERQWHKTFAYGKTYQHIVLKGSPRTEEIVEAEYVGNTAIVGNLVIIYWFIVGTLQSINTIAVKKQYNYLINEIQNIWPQYRIILEETSQKRPMAKKKPQIGW